MTESSSKETGPDALSSAEIHSALDVVLQWDYASGPDSLARLYARAAEAQWIAHRDLDWDAEVDVEQVTSWGEQMEIIARTSYWRALDPAVVADFRRRSAVMNLSNFLHGEQAALVVAGQLVGAVPDMRAKLYAASQTADEARHVDAFSRYLTRFGTPLPASRGVRLVIDRILATGDWVQKLVGMQIMVEGIALYRFREMLSHNREPLLRKLLTYVARDESRHHAYGITYLTTLVPALSPAARAEVEDFLFETVRTYIAPENNQDAFAMFRSCGIDFEALVACYMREEASIVARVGTTATFEPVRGFVLPALRRAGLLSERLAERFYELLPATMLSGTLTEFLGMVADLATAEAAAVPAEAP